MVNDILFLLLLSTIALPATLVKLDMQCYAP